MDGFCRELGVSKDEALNLIGRSVAIAKQARKWHRDEHMREVSDVTGASLGMRLWREPHTNAYSDL